MEMKTKINKRFLIKLTSSCSAKDIIKKEKNEKKMKRQPMGWEKIVTSNATVKGLISKIYKQLTQLSNNKKQITQLENGQKK